MSAARFKHAARSFFGVLTQAACAFAAFVNARFTCSAEASLTEPTLSLCTAGLITATSAAAVISAKPGPIESAAHCCDIRL